MEYKKNIINESIQRVLTEGILPVDIEGVTELRRTSNDEIEVGIS